MLNKEDLPFPSSNEESDNQHSINDNDLADDIFGSGSYEAEPRKKQNYLPWHKPRKQYVREIQWCDEIRKMIREIFPENNVIKYLGLPGDDFLDIRYFHDQICQPNQLKLKFLGFNDGIRKYDRKTEINISLNELSRLKYYDSSSEIIPDDFRDIANTDSIAWKKTRQTGPYDVINIDLCDGIGKLPADKFIETHYTTMARLMSLQAKRRDPWLLLITTKTSRTDIHPDVLIKLKDLYKSNMAECQGFYTASVDKFNLADDASIDSACDSEKGLSDVFLISLCKWLAKLAIAEKSHLEVTSVIGYKVYKAAKHQDLVSIAIKVTPLVIIEKDSVGLAQSHPTDAKPDECMIAIQALESIHAQIDADKMLDDDPGLWKHMAEESEKLLESARYDIGGYQEWAKKSS